MIRDQLVARAANLRERADKIEANIAGPSPMAEHFPLGAGAARPSGERGHRAGAADARRDAAADRDLVKTSQAFREVARLRREAETLEYRAEHEIQADDIDGLTRLVETHERHVENLTRMLADPAKVAKYGKPEMTKLRADERRKAKAARLRLSRSTTNQEVAA